jgi:hypothetical protein
LEGGLVFDAFVDREAGDAEADAEAGEGGEGSLGAEEESL